MVLISKHHFDSTWTSIPCNVIVHPWTNSCLQAAPTFYANTLLGSAKFFSLIYLAQIIVGSKRKTERKQWINIAKNYLRSIATGTLVTATGFQLVCLFRNLLGRFSYYTFVMIPMTISGILLYLETPTRRRWLLNAYSNLIIEYCLKQLEDSGYLSLSKTKQVVLFMLGNALLLYLMRLERNKQEENHVFWLFTPEKVRKKSEGCKNVCPHEGDCKKHILKGASTYFGIALAISLAKVIIPQIKTPVKAISSIKARHLKLAFFLSSYIGLYKAIICYLCRKNGSDSALYALPAGCVAGLSSVFSSHLGLTIASFTASMQLFSTTLYEKKILPSNEHLPMVMTCLFQGILFSGGILDSDVCPKYVLHVMTTISNGLVDVLAKNFYEIVKKNITV